MRAGVLGGWRLGRRRGAGQGGIFYGDRVGMTFDDGRTETLEALLVLATTLERLVLGSRPFWGGGGGHLRFTAVAYPPQGLLRHARRVLYGGEDRALPAGYRSEEHTSELQSLMRISYAVFCLKKKNNKKQKN